MFYQDIRAHTILSLFQKIGGVLAMKKHIKWVSVTKFTAHNFSIARVSKKDQRYLLEAVSLWFMTKGRNN